MSLENCGCDGCNAGLKEWDPQAGMHVNFCGKCTRAYCYGSGPNNGSGSCCYGCSRCQQGKCLEEPSDREESEEEPEEEEPVMKKAKTEENPPKVPALAEQSEIRVVGASSQQDSAVNVLMNDNGTTYWKSDEMKGKNRKEQYVEFQLAPDNTIRRLGSVEVYEARDVQVSDLRMDYSTDGSSWKRGFSIWGLESYGIGDCGCIRSNDDLGNLEARLVRIVCKKPTGYKSKVGFAYVEFNRVAKMFSS